MILIIVCKINVLSNPTFTTSHQYEECPYGTVPVSISFNLPERAGGFWSNGIRFLEARSRTKKDLYKFTLPADDQQNERMMMVIRESKNKLSAIPKASFEGSESEIREHVAAELRLAK